MPPVIDFRRLNPRLTETDLAAPPFVPELSPVTDRKHSGSELMTRPWLDWARRITLLLSGGGGSGGGGESDPTHVVGPATAITDDIALYDGTTGKLIKDSLKTIAQVISDAVSQAIAAILPGGKLPVANLSAHHTTHEPGGSDAVVNAAWTNVNNVFTAPLQQIGSGVNPRLSFYDSAPAVDARVFRIMDSVQSFRFEALNDAQTLVQTAPLVLDRLGNAVVGNNLTATGSGGNVACKDQANTFTQDQTLSTGSVPTFWINDSSQPANQRKYRIGQSGQNLLFQPATDAGSGTLSSLTLNRAGDGLIGRDIYEKQRATALGHWIDVPFSAGNFNSDTGSWAVTAGQQATFSYELSGKTVTVSVYLVGTTVTGTPAVLKIQMPIGITFVKTQGQPFHYFSGVAGTGFCVVTPGTSILQMQRDVLGTAWVAGATHVLATVRCAIQ